MKSEPTFKGAVCTGKPFQDQNAIFSVHFVYARASENVARVGAGGYRGGSRWLCQERPASAYWWRLWTMITSACSGAATQCKKKQFNFLASPRILVLSPSSLSGIICYFCLASLLLVDSWMSLRLTVDPPSDLLTSCPRNSRSSFLCFRLPSFQYLLLFVSVFLCVCSYKCLNNFVSFIFHTSFFFLSCIVLFLLSLYLILFLRNPVNFYFSFSFSLSFFHSFLIIFHVICASWFYFLSFLGTFFFLSSSQANLSLIFIHVTVVLKILHAFWLTHQSRLNVDWYYWRCHEHTAT